MTRFRLLGVPVDPMTEAEAIDWVSSAISAGQPRLVASVNPERIMQARREPGFASILRNVDLALADGVGVVWAARRLGHPLPQRISGVDFVEALAAKGAKNGWRFFFLGGAPGVAEAAGAVLSRRYPGFILAGTFAGSPDPGDDQAATRAIQASHAQLLFVAYGGGAEEAWLARNLADSGAAVGMGVGGSFDFISGRAQRAPRWMRDHGLEWLHRLSRQPWRWRRMLVLPRFALVILTQRRS